MGYAKLTLDRADQSVATSFSSTIGFFESKTNRLPEEKTMKQK